jgi:UMF1 family MFS transporter
VTSLPTTVPRRIARRAVVGWVLYDLANTMFSMGVISLYFSLWVRDEVGATRADSAYGIITAISMAVIFVASPLLGAMSDRAPRRMPFLVVSTLLCVALTALLARFTFMATVLCFMGANITYQAGLQFYDACSRKSARSNRGASAGSASASAAWAYARGGIGLLLERQTSPCSSRSSRARSPRSRSPASSSSASAQIPPTTDQPPCGNAVGPRHPARSHRVAVPRPAAVPRGRVFLRTRSTP